MLTREIKSLGEYKLVNEFLKQNNWFFIAPLFFQGYDLSAFLTLSQKEGNHKVEITKRIFRKFYDLNNTANFIEGYCKRCNHIEPFLKSIEHSLVLTFQRDYEGGIKTLIPIVEGILRKYLNLEQGLEMNKIGFKHLKNSLLTLKQAVIADYEKWLNNYVDGNKRKILFTEREIKELVELKTEYNTLWFSFLTEFIDNYFYLDTSKNPINNELNRHAILHEYGLDISYNLENYIKIYFVIHFLTWIFLMKENKSLFNEINGFRYFEKAIAYRNIIKGSRKLYFDKHLLYKNYKGYSNNQFRDELDFRFENPVPFRKMIVYNFLKTFSRLFWRKFGVDISNKSVSM